MASVEQHEQAETNGGSAHTIPVENPATGELVGTIPDTMPPVGWVGTIPRFTARFGLGPSAPPHRGPFRCRARFLGGGDLLRSRPLVEPVELRLGIIDA